MERDPINEWKQFVEHSIAFDYEIQGGGRAI